MDVWLRISKNQLEMSYEVLLAGSQNLILKALEMNCLILGSAGMQLEILKTYFQGDVLDLEFNFSLYQV